MLARWTAHCVINELVQSWVLNPIEDRAGQAGVRCVGELSPLRRCLRQQNSGDCGRRDVEAEEERWMEKKGKERPTRMPAALGRRSVMRWKEYGFH